MRQYACWLVVVGSVASAAAQELALVPTPGVLLLRNGSVLEGSILKEGDRYVVSLEDGNLRVRAKDVQFVGKSLDDCYEHLRRSMEFDRVENHLDLAEWCLRFNMLPQAGRELAAAMRSDSRHPKIPLIERRLRLALEGPGETRPAEPGLLHVASADELDRMVRSLPAGTVETFTNTIQPMLLNQCSTAACHGPTASNSLHLIRASAGRVQSRRATQRNLHAVLQMIDKENPDQSRLLTATVGPHGPSQIPVFVSKQNLQYRQLVEWARAVSNKRKSSVAPSPTSTDEWPLANQDATATPESIPPNTLGTTPAARVLRGSEETSTFSGTAADPGIQPAGFAEPSDTNDSADEDLKETEESFDISEPSKGQRAPKRLSRRHVPGQLPARSPAKRGAPPKDDAPRDPFDPEIFNRQFADQAEKP